VLAWIITATLCLLVVIAAGWAIIRLLALGSDAGAADSEGLPDEDSDDDSGDWSWTSTSDARWTTLAGR
jgi:hypothetical protein